MSDDPDAIRESLKPLIQLARERGVWIWCGYQGLWFSPDDLEKANAEGKFLWGGVNWKLRDPREHQAELDHIAKDAIDAARRFRLRWTQPL